MRYHDEDIIYKKVSWISKKIEGGEGIYTRRIGRIDRYK